MNLESLWDDPEKDYRQRYILPEQFIWDRAAWARIDFDGYTTMAIDLLPKPPCRVLDVGSGPGLGSMRLKDRGYDVVGVDYSSRAVDFANLMVEDVTFVDGDIRALEQLSELGDRFDAAVCIEVFEHVPPQYRSQVLTGIRLKLRPSGVLVISTPSPAMCQNRWDYERPSLDQLRALLLNAGFRVTEVRYQHELTLWFRPWVWRLFSNRWYDLRVIRHLLRARFLGRWNEARGESSAGRYVIRSERSD